MQKEEILVSALTAGGMVSGGYSPPGDIPSVAACLFPGATAVSPRWRREDILMPSWGIRQERQSHSRHLGVSPSDTRVHTHRFHLSSGNTELRQIFNTKVRSKRGLTGVGDYLSHSLRYEAVSSEGLN